ncbi:MAG: hypothetical protein JKY01_05540 [Pseudomonadales bacterium]|nr:hypothetical protein [Pseudomonadales bacterium]
MRTQRSRTAQIKPKHQKGSVLLICLILMIAVTLLGISSMNTTIVEHKIVSNTRNQTLALSGAESALSEATEIIQGQSGTQKRSGIRLQDLQNNDMIIDRSNLNSLVSTATITLNGTQSTSIPLWGAGAVTNNPSYLGSSSKSNWWASSANTSALSKDLTSTNAQLANNNYFLATNPRYVIEKGEFIPDDLNPNTLAAYRGRQAFTAISRSSGSTATVNSTLQASVATRFR